MQTHHPVGNRLTPWLRFWVTATNKLKLWIKNCGQTAADGDMVTIDNLSLSTYTMVPSPTSHDLPFSHNTARLTPWLRHREIQHVYIAGILRVRWWKQRRQMVTLRQLRQQLRHRKQRRQRDISSGCFWRQYARATWHNYDSCWSGCGRAVWMWTSLM